MVEVTLENHSACMALFKESEMFDYWSLFRGYRTKMKETLTQGIGGVVCECDVGDVVRVTNGSRVRNHVTTMSYIIFV